jgi:hypothetical protein
VCQLNGNGQQLTVAPILPANRVAAERFVVDVMVLQVRIEGRFRVLAHLLCHPLLCGQQQFSRAHLICHIEAACLLDGHQQQSLCFGFKASDQPSQAGFTRKPYVPVCS